MLKDAIPHPWAHFPAFMIGITLNVERLEVGQRMYITFEVSNNVATACVVSKPLLELEEVENQIQVETDVTGLI